jgi:hypothetical protein
MAVAGLFQVRLWGHRDLQAHAMCYATDRLQHDHAPVRSGQGLHLLHGELQVPVPHLSVALLRPDAHLLQRLRQLSDELRSRGQGEAAGVWRPIQGTVRITQVELGLVGGDGAVTPGREPSEDPA